MDIAHGAAMTRAIFFGSQILIFQFFLLFFNASQDGIIDSIRFKWNARWMAQFKKDVNYSETGESASSLIRRYDSLQKNIAEQQNLIEETGRKIMREKSGISVTIKRLKKLSLDLKGDLINLESQRDLLLKDFKSKRSNLVKINRDYRANSLSLSQNTLNDVNKLLDYKLLLNIRGRNSGEQLSLDTIETRLKAQISKSDPIRMIESSDLATRFTDPLKQARLENTVYKEFLKKVERYGRSACRSQGKGFVSAEVVLKQDQHSVSPNRKISRITLSESFEHSFVKAAFGAGIGAAFGAVGGFIGTFRWIDSLGPNRVTSLAQADEQAILALIAATFGSVAGSAGGFLASLIPAGLFMVVDSLKNYYFNKGKEIGPRNYASKAWLHDYSVETVPLSAQKVPHVEVVVQCAGTQNISDLNYDHARPYVSSNAVPRGDFEWINTVDRLTGRRNQTPITGEFSYLNGFRSFSAW